MDRGSKTEISKVEWKKFYKATAKSTIKKEGKFFIVNLKYMDQLSHAGKKSLDIVVAELNERFPSVRNNNYICCNQNEPYADDVWEVILEGEKRKVEEPKP